MNEKGIIHKLYVKVEAKSRAKLGWWIFQKSTKSYIEGQPYDVECELINISDQPFPGGRIHVDINWPSGQTVFLR